jgi:outer membrane immunogenic protein
MLAIRNQWLLATASAVAGAGAFSGAADAQSVLPPAPSATNWTGFYAGLNLSATRHYASTQDVNGFGQSSIGSPPYVTPFFDSKKTNIGFGGQVGYNFQFSSFVTGLEADLGYVGAKTTFAPPSFFTNNPTGNCSAQPNTCVVSATNELTWLATFRGRAGIVVDKALLYGTAGLALGGIKNRWGYGDTRLTGNSGFSDSYFNVDTVRTGFIYGGGVEFAATQRWLVRLEAMHVNFGTSSSSFTGNSDWAAPGTFTTNFKNSATIGRAALSWRW